MKKSFSNCYAVETRMLLTKFENKLFEMLTHIHPKLSMRDKAATIAYYVDGLCFKILGDYGDYLILGKDSIEVNFFLFRELNPKENYGQLYVRTNDIDSLYRTLQINGVAIHPNGSLASKPWGQKEFSLLDPDHNLLTFGQGSTN